MHATQMFANIGNGSSRSMAYLQKHILELNFKMRCGLTCIEMWHYISFCLPAQQLRMRRNRTEDSCYYLKKAQTRSVDIKNKTLTSQSLKDMLMQAAGILRQYFQDRTP